VLAQCQYRTRSGRIRTRATARIRKAIADYLSLPYEVLWGPQASRHLRRLIEEEIDRQVGHSAAKAAMEKSRELRRELLDEAQEQAA
jgi:hypothetical protein